MKKKKPFECSKCDGKFARKGSLNAHIVSYHEGRKPYECSTCYTKFVTKSALN